MTVVSIIGAGLAGSEAAWQLAQRGIAVRLYEQRPLQTTPVHQTALFAELVCSNSLRAAGLTNAVGLLKAEMRQLDSLIMRCADACRIPAGGALAVDREGFAALVTSTLTAHPLVEVVVQQVEQIPDGPLIIASGPLTTGGLAEQIKGLTGAQYLHFHDAVAPIVTADSINMEVAYRASRYGKGENPEGDYLNCPMTKVQYDAFYQELVGAELLPLHGFEVEKDFDGCMPIESMARRGYETMTFGPLKPVGLDNPHDGSRPYAVVQLRQDNAAGTLYNIVGFQTRLKWGEQKRVFSLIPGLEQAEFVRYGVMHRNTYIDSTRLLLPTMQLKGKPQIFFAGQLTGVEGYVESAACGLAAGINAARSVQGKQGLEFPQVTALGSLLRYITTPCGNFQPMNVTFGLIPPLESRIRNKQERNQVLAERSLAALADFSTDD